jgi:membrane protease YdiL (CAAX protease family)
MDKPNRPLKGPLTALLVTAAGVGLAFLIERHGVGWISKYRSTLIAAIWLYFPLPFILFKKESPANYGIGWGRGLRGLGETLAVSIVVLIPFYAVFFSIYPPRWALHMLPKGLPAAAVLQFLVISLPEEFFFRGYLQTELEKISDRKWKLLGAQLGTGWIAASAIFALGHLAVFPSLLRAGVFFPALLFGWARARTGSILHSSIMHALFNFTFLAAQKISGI